MKKVLLLILCLAFVLSSSVLVACGKKDKVTYEVSVEQFTKALDLFNGKNFTMNTSTPASTFKLEVVENGSYAGVLVEGKEITHIVALVEPDGTYSIYFGEPNEDNQLVWELDKAGVTKQDAQKRMEGNGSPLAAFAYVKTISNYTYDEETKGYRSSGVIDETYYDFQLFFENAFLKKASINIAGYLVTLQFEQGTADLSDEIAALTAAGLR